jgi:hypothetical protein
MRQLIAAAILTSAAIAHAGTPGTHEVSFGSKTRALRTSSANALTDESLAGGGVAYEHALGFRLIPDLALWATATIGGGSADGTLFQTMSTDLDTFDLGLGARARYPLRGQWLRATARLAVGAARTSVELRDEGHTAGDSAWGPTVESALGLELATARPNARISFGVRLEVGYVAAAPVSLTATPSSGSGGTLQLDMSPASLGRLNMSGGTFAFSLLSEF